MLLSGGQAGDNPYLLPVLDAIAIRGPAGGRPRKRPDLLLADKGYAHDRTRAALRRRAIPHNIPERHDQIARRAARGSCGGRPPAFSPHAGLAAETHVTILNANLDDAVARQVAGAQIL